MCRQTSHIFIISRPTLLILRFAKSYKYEYYLANLTTPTHRLLYMGCYGIGITRLLAASVEAHSTDTELRWPHAIAPYKYCVIPQKVRYT